MSQSWQSLRNKVLCWYNSWSSLGNEYFTVLFISLVIVTFIVVVLPFHIYLFYGIFPPPLHPTKTMTLAYQLIPIHIPPIPSLQNEGPILTSHIIRLPLHLLGGWNIPPHDFYQRHYCASNLKILGPRFIGSTHSLNRILRRYPKLGTRSLFPPLPSPIGLHPRCFLCRFHFPHHFCCIFCDTDPPPPLFYPPLPSPAPSLSSIWTIPQHPSS